MHVNHRKSDPICCCFCLDISNNLIAPNRALKKRFFSKFKYLLSFVIFWIHILQIFKINKYYKFVFKYVQKNIRSFKLVFKNVFPLSI